MIMYPASMSLVAQGTGCRLRHFWCHDGGAAVLTVPNRDFDAEYLGALDEVQ